MGKARSTSGAGTLFFIVVALVGLCLLLYPTVSNYLNERGQMRAIFDYSQVLETVEPEGYEGLWAEARAYNEALLGRENDRHLSEDLLARYEKVLDVSGTGIMGYVEIPCINCTLPIYHGTDEAELQVAVGHIEWTSLPVGGPSTHSAISGHRGLPSAELLTNIDKLEFGDAFYIHVLDTVLEYRVDDIAVVLPDDTERLRVVEGQDYVTLVTCTPYSVNSHRLLVRGVRMGEDGLSTSNAALLLSDEIRPISLMYVIPVALVAAVLATAVVLWLKDALRKRRAGAARHGRQAGAGFPKRRDLRSEDQEGSRKWD
ncbi:MAG: class C sortase [Eggerthellaceae bacterium]|nr:class C sortase [Eggerthellaceae bacterium]